MHIERFAPSPTGKLHLGHAFSAILVALSARKNKGHFILRIEDLDFNRCLRRYEESILYDLEWLGISWKKHPIRQSERFHLYNDAINKLWEMGVLYKCECTREQIVKAQKKLSEFVYPGICKKKKILHDNYSLRLDTTKALEMVNTSSLSFFGKREIDQKFELNSIQPEAMIKKYGDVVISRRDIRTSYHIAVVVDDHFQKITQITRGFDLYESTFCHVLLQKLLKFHTPNYFHHKILYDKDGKKLAKRTQSTTLEHLREKGLSKNDIYNLIGLKIT